MTRQQEARIAVLDPANWAPNLRRVVHTRADGDALLTCVAGRRIVEISVDPLGAASFLFSDRATSYCFVGRLRRGREGALRRKAKDFLEAS